MSWVDSLLGSTLGFNMNDPCGESNKALYDYRPIAFHQVTPSAPSTTYLYCGWLTGNTAFRCLLCLFALLLFAALLLNVFRFRLTALQHALSALCALCALLFFVSLIYDANALRTASDADVCRLGTSATAPKPTPTTTYTFKCDLQPYIATVVSDAIIMLLWAASAVASFFYVRMGWFAQEVQGEGGQGVDYFGEAEKYFPDDHDRDTAEGDEAKAASASKW